MSRCTLELEETLVAVAHGGTLEAEYALFDPGDIALIATAPGTIRETGYRTTVGEALSRLAHFGLTRTLAEDAAAAAKVWIARAYARGGAVRAIVDRLDAAELFDGGTYDPTSARYAGVWLDLPALMAALSADLDPARCATLLQATHLAALLAERSESALLTLATAEVTALRRPGERTFKRVALKEAQTLVRALGAPQRTAQAEGPGTGPSRQEIVAWLRERALRLPGASPRFAAIEASLCAREPPARGPLADAELWSIETTLSLGETEGVVERLSAIEKRLGRRPGTTYLRARAAFMAGSEEPRAIAQRVSDLSTSMTAFHELQLLAAQAWAAAGDVRHAHAFARDLSEDATASDALRMHAREVLDAAARARTASEGSEPFIPRPPLAPSGTRVDLQANHSPSDIDGAEQTSDRTRPGGDPTRSLRVDMSLPFFRTESRANRVWSIADAREIPAENVETLSLPLGMRDEPPPHNEPPRTPPAARIACTYLARELARELRMRHGAELVSDVDGLETAQRYLCETIAGEHVSTTEEERDAMRYGAFLSELLARRLSARWDDLESLDAGRWAMLIPSRSQPDEVSRVWPFARVLRFVARRHKERDLVSYYLQLEARAR